MSYKALNWAWEQTGLSSSEKFLLVALADFADEAHSCYPGHARLAAMTAMTERSVGSNLSKLEDRGFILRVHRLREDRRGRTSDRYWLDVGDRRQRDQPEESSTSSGDDQPETCADQPETDAGSTRNSEQNQPETVSGEPSVEPSVNTLGASAPEEKPAATKTAGGDTTGRVATLIAEWTSRCESRPARKTIGQVRNELSLLLVDEGHDYQRVRAALAAWHQHGYGPGAIPTFLTQQAKQRRPARSEEDIINGTRTDGWGTSEEDLINK